VAIPFAGGGELKHSCNRLTREGFEEGAPLAFENRTTGQTLSSCAQYGARVRASCGVEELIPSQVEGTAQPDFEDEGIWQRSQ
jgi:hypothetical protein